MNAIITIRIIPVALVVSVWKAPTVKRISFNAAGMAGDTFKDRMA